ncbi:MAG: methylated-DNA--[protein]-cysteine S-methyltransferase [Bacillota bacterium]
MLFTTMKDTPVGPLTLAAESGIITKLEFRALNDRDIGDTAPSQDDISVLERAVSELTLYFQGGLQEFTVPVRIDGPPFHKKVWQHLCTIPYGRTESYGDIARSLGCPSGARAVGNACARNPVAIIVPCHRVLSRGHLGGFGGGLDAKIWLLKHEGCRI